MYPLRKTVMSVATKLWLGVFVVSTAPDPQTLEIFRRANSQYEECFTSQLAQELQALLQAHVKQARFRWDICPKLAVLTASLMT
jgi:hypothetical protein